MRKDVIGRLVYVTRLQDSIRKGSLDFVSLPDTEALAKAFAEFPSRREVPFLLTRSSRLLYQAGRKDIFRLSQRKFLEQLDIDQVIQRICADTSDAGRHEGIMFLVAVSAEAYSPSSSAQDEHEKESLLFISNLSKFIAPLNKCKSESLEAYVYKIRLEDMINGISTQIKLPAPYDIEVELRSFEEALYGANASAVMGFWQSHAAQEYLDFRAFRIIDGIVRDYNNAPREGRADTCKMDVAISYYEKLLLLRQSSLRPGDVMWTSPPNKLTIFYAFMIDANVNSLVWDDFKKLYTTVPCVKAAIIELTKRKVFEEFQSPRGWYVGTPLDFGLNGPALIDKVNTWLKKEW